MKLWISHFFSQYSQWLFPILFLGGLLFLLLRQYFINKAPTYTAAATVKSRRRGHAKYRGKYTSGYNYLVTFLLGDSDTIELYVSEMEYIQLQEGLRGQLLWQNENMLSFETDS